jgi:hypothetical protein
VSRIPTDQELMNWQVRQKALYRDAHRAQNDAMRRLATEELTSSSPGMVRADGDCFTGNVSAVLAHVEAENDAAESLVWQPSDDRIAVARDRGFKDRRNGLAATDNPHSEPEYDLFMAWYAGWVQARPIEVLGVNDPKRTRGYIPPTGYRCIECDRPENTLHRRSCSYRGIFSEAAMRVTRGQCGELVKDKFPVEQSP